MQSGSEKKVFPMSCFGATISSFFNGKVKKNMKKKNDIQKVEEKVQYFSYYFFSCLSLAIREKKRNFYLRCTSRVDFHSWFSRGEVFPSLMSPVVL